MFRPCAFSGLWFVTDKMFRNCVDSIPKVLQEPFVFLALSLLLVDLSTTFNSDLKGVFLRPPGEALGLERKLHERRFSIAVFRDQT